MELLADWIAEMNPGITESKSSAGRTLDMTLA